MLEFQSNVCKYKFIFHEMTRVKLIASRGDVYGASLEM